MDVGQALKNSSKGRLKYDRNWASEGRAKEILEEISKYTNKVSLSISPKALSILVQPEEALVNHQTITKSKGTHTNKTSKDQTIHHHDLTDLYFYELQSEMEIPILEYEEGRKNYIQEVFNEKKKEYDNKSSELQQKINQEYLFLKRQNELDSMQRAIDLHNIEDALLKEAQQKELQQKEQYQTHVKKLSAKVLEAELKQKQAEEKLKKKEQEQVELHTQLENCFKEAKNLINKSREKLDACDCLENLQVSYNDRIKDFSKLLHPITNLINQSTTIELSIDDILNANLQVRKAFNILQEISNDVEFAKNKESQLRSVQKVPFSFKENTNVKDTTKLNNITQADSAKDDSVITETANESKRPQNNKAADNKENAAKELLYQHISPDAFPEYVKIMENLKRIEVLIDPLKSDPKNKKRRFELQKSINVPINSLTSVSGSQVKSKINRLLSILNGSAQETQGEAMNANSIVYNFCANLISKQFVEQGDSQIAAQHSTAYPIAMALLHLWNKKPEIGSLIQSHFYRVCPYLVPYYPLREEGQTDQEYYKSLGYYFDHDGKMEEQYKFLNRISGFMRLYAAVMVSSLPPNTTTPHPQNISCGWTWLSRTLNLDPHPDITATLLFDFLEVAGHALQKAYGKQFKKMLHILCKDYFSKIKQVSHGGSGGPVERLEIFLQQTVKKGYISPPTGILDSSFWLK